MEKIKLGDKVRDKVTGFEGIATSETKHLNGCIQMGVTGKLKKGQKVEDLDGIAIDIAQLEKIGNGLNTPKKKILEESNGGPMRKVSRSLY